MTPLNNSDGGSPMGKKASTPPSPPASSKSTVVIVAVFGMLFGATLTYFALRPKEPPAGLSATTNPPSNPDPTTHRPSPDLTAGKNPAEAERALGNFYYDHQNWPQAIQRYESAIRQGSDDADIRTDLGNAYRFAGRPDDALAQYSLARKMNPDHEHSLFNQGGLYLDDLQQPGRAVEIWQEYLVRFPTGRNADAARQLIARAQGGFDTPSLPVAHAPAAEPRVTPAEEMILRQIQAARTREEKP
jgi:tetratricopeptide (TPR) repeat protein